jgi:hypothetical protein
MQIKTTLRFHFTPVRMAIIKNTNINKFWQGCDKTGILIRRWWECRLVQPLREAKWKFLKILKKELPYIWAVLLPGMYLKECKSGYQKDTCTLMFIIVLFTQGKLWRQAKWPTTDEWITDWLLFSYREEWYIICR